MLAPIEEYLFLETNNLVERELNVVHILLNIFNPKIYVCYIVFLTSGLESILHIGPLNICFGAS